MALKLGIIPARYSSQRFPGKLLKQLKGYSVLERTWQQACKANSLDEVIIAAADERIAHASREFGANVIEVFDDLPSGTDRIAKAVKMLYPNQTKPNVVVNIQGDEPLIDPQTIDVVVQALSDDNSVEVATCATIIKSEVEYNDPAAVKVVVDKNGKALYFSRSMLPHGWVTGDKCAYRHVGLYAFTWNALSEFVRLESGELERLERLEQLRLLYHGIDIKTVLVGENSPGIDTEADFIIVESMIE